MKRYYTDEDVLRWQKAHKDSVQLQLEKLKSEAAPERIDFRLGMLTLAYQTQGMIAIALGQFQEAIDAFCASGETRFKMFERSEAGVGRELEAGYYQEILVSFVTRKESLISKLVRLYRADNGTPDSMYLGRALKHLATNDLAAALTALSAKKPRFEGQFVGYADCLEAIAKKDKQAFLVALETATKSWTKVAARRDRGLPPPLSNS